LDEVKAGKPEGKQPTEKSVSVQSAKNWTCVCEREARRQQSREAVRQSKVQVCMSFDFTLQYRFTIYFCSTAPTAIDPSVNAILG
jgi:hypothetical protein